MREALKLAASALDHGELPIGAVVVLDNRIIASAHTMEKSEKRLLVHADLLALEAADRIRPFPGDRREVRLFVNLEPCLMCLGAAMSFRTGELYYGRESPGDVAAALVQEWQRDQSQAPFYQVPKIYGGILRQESIDLFKRYTARHSSGPLWKWARALAAL